MTYSVSLGSTSTVGAGEILPTATAQHDLPSTTVFDRSNLGFHLKIGSKVINM